MTSILLFFTRTIALVIAVYVAALQSSISNIPTIQLNHSPYIYAMSLHIHKLPIPMSN